MTDKKLAPNDIYDMVDMITSTAASNVFTSLKTVVDDFTLCELGNMFEGLTYKVDPARHVLHIICRVDVLGESKKKTRGRLLKGFEQVNNYHSLMDALCNELKQSSKEVTDIITSKAYEHLLQYYVTRVRSELDKENQVARVSYAFAH